MHGAPQRRFGHDVEQRAEIVVLVEDLGACTMAPIVADGAGAHDGHVMAEEKPAPGRLRARPCAGEGNMRLTIVFARLLLQFVIENMCFTICKKTCLTICQLLDILERRSLPRGSD